MPSSRPGWNWIHSTLIPVQHSFGTEHSCNYEYLNWILLHTNLFTQIYSFLFLMIIYSQVRVLQMILSAFRLTLKGRLVQYLGRLNIETRQAWNLAHTLHREKPLTNMLHKKTWIRIFDTKHLVKGRKHFFSLPIIVDCANKLDRKKSKQEVLQKEVNLQETAKN